mgnify:CR=1 FL=1
MDPKVWGQNWPAQYDGYLKTSLPTATKYGGRGLGASDAGPAEQKLDRDPVAPAHLRRLRLCHRLSRSARPRLRPLRSGADAPRDREEAARRVPAVPRGEPRPVPLRRQGQCHRRLRAGIRHAIRGGAEHEGRQGPAPDPAPARLRGLPRVQDHGPPCDPPRVHRRDQSPQGQAGHCGLRPEPRCHPPGDAGVRLRSVPRGVLLQGRRQGRHVSVGQWPQGRGDRGVLRQGGLHGLGARGDGDQDAQGPAPGVRGVEPGHSRARRRGVRGLATCPTSEWAPSR